MSLHCHHQKRLSAEAQLDAANAADAPSKSQEHDPKHNPLLKYLKEVGEKRVAEKKARKAALKSARAAGDNMHCHEHHDVA